MRTLQEKVATVQEALQPGSSVAAVARKHGVNANLLFGVCACIVSDRRRHPIIASSNGDA